jgi:TfoX/Sxy family transcriptional regulator of competence genes
LVSRESSECSPTARGFDYASAIAEPFLTDLNRLADQWTQADSRIGSLACRHFFSGAAAYRNDTIVASLTPVGLAFKVTPEVRVTMLKSGPAIELRYFSKSPVKREFVLFELPEDVSPDKAAGLILGRLE